MNNTIVKFKKFFLLNFKSIKSFFTRIIYADHNNSRFVKSALNKLLIQYNNKSFVLNIGSGNKRIAPHVKNLDIFKGTNIDYVCNAEKIPIKKNSVDLIITQETFEHISKPKKALKECYRILKTGGRIYFQVPFIIGYHPGPTDFYRFTREGIIAFLSESGFKVEKVDITVAGAVGFYRVAVEFFAILFSGPISILYILFKGIFSLLLYPIKIIDFWFRLSKQRDRIAGGYYAIGKKFFREK
jgi:SAM-dependent methyltransferase